MDAEKRHQLKSNELAEALAKLRNFWNDPQTLYWLLGLVVIAAAYGGYRFWTYTRAHQVRSAWRQLSQAGVGSADIAAAIADLEAIVHKNTDHGVTASSRIRLAAALRLQAEADPARHEELLLESVAVLRAVVEDPAVPTPLVAAATFSLGTSYESLREYDRARALYESLAQERFAGSPFQWRAADRLATFDKLPGQSPFVPDPPPQPDPVAAAPPTATLPDTQPAETHSATDQPVAQEAVGADVPSDVSPPQAAPEADVSPQPPEQVPEPHDPDADWP